MDEQRSDGWYEARLGKATSSNFASILMSPSTAGYKNYKAQLVTERLVGLKEETYTNGAMQHGIDCEPLAREAYEEITGTKVEKAPFVEHSVLEAGASPDGYVGEEGLVEIKCPNTATHIDTLKSGKAPTKYIPQMQGQLWITNRKWCDFVSFDPRLPDNAKLFITRVHRDDKYIEVLESKVTKFLEEVEQDFNFINEYKG